MYGLNLHVSEALKSQDLCDQIQGVNAGAWFEFDDEGLFRAQYNARRNEIVVLHGPCAVTLKLSDSKEAVTGVIGQPRVSQEELMQLDTAGILRANALRDAIDRVSPMLNVEPQTDDDVPPESNRPTATASYWQPPAPISAPVVRQVAADEFGGHVVLLPHPLPFQNVFAANELLLVLAQRMNDMANGRMKLVDVHSERPGRAIFGWFNPDKNALCVFDGHELNRSLFNLNEAGDRVVSITTDLPPLAGIARLENLGIIYRGVCPSS
ncbi:hypothetical protein [Caenimonas koreensis]|uniref:hypothetical protein n=1 Tax=Caenimonas koreensis TaxID=367474 RepID=UPI003782DAA8